jgi:hypothetical protein
MKFFCASLTAILLLAGRQAGFSQSFINLDFESADTSELSENSLPASSAFPGWSAYLGPPGNPTQINIGTVAYDTTSLGGALVILVDSDAFAPYNPIQGNYSALLEGSEPAAGSTASLGQTGTIPNNAQSLIFWASLAGSSLDVSFNGHMLPLVAISNAANYAVYGANISAFAGQTGQLLFTAPVNTGSVFDNIQFSTSPVPEPGELALAALGGLCFVWRRWKKQS